MENFMRHAWKDSHATLTINLFDGLGGGFGARAEIELVCMIDFVASFLGVQSFLRTGYVSIFTDGSRMTRECPVRFWCAVAQIGSGRWAIRTKKRKEVNSTAQGGYEMAEDPLESLSEQGL
jgi:hypothetical protein